MAGSDQVAVVGLEERPCQQTEDDDQGEEYHEEADVRSEGAD